MLIAPEHPSADYAALLDRLMEAAASITVVTDHRPGFLWVCRLRAVAYQFSAAMERTGGECAIHTRAARRLGETWVGPRWIFHAWSLTERELNALQRLATRIDPSAAGLVWDAKTSCYISARVRNNFCGEGKSTDGQRTTKTLTLP